MSAIRPNSLSDFVGQQNARRILNVLIAAAKRRNETVPHILMSCSAGLPKTTFARILARTDARSTAQSLPTNHYSRTLLGYRSSRDHFQRRYQTDLRPARRSRPTDCSAVTREGSNGDDEPDVVSRLRSGGRRHRHDGS